MEAQRKRPWWRKKRWQAAMLLWLAALYPASIGPVDYVSRLHLLGRTSADAYRAPAERLLPRFSLVEQQPTRLEGDVLIPNMQPNPWTHWFWRYVDWWDELGRRHAGL